MSLYVSTGQLPNVVFPLDSNYSYNNLQTFYQDPTVNYLQMNSGSVYYKGAFAAYNGAANN